MAVGRVSAAGPDGEPRELLLIRHAEAVKNLLHQRGGSGTALTDEGRRQAARLSAHLDRQGDGELRLAYHDVTHVEETVSSLELERPNVLLQVPDLRGIHLGLIDGLSAAEAERDRPAAVTALDQWKEGRRRVDRLSLPQAEDLHGFERRVRRALAEVLGAGRHVAIVATQSTLIMIHNLFEMGADFDYESYRYVQFPNCGGFCWQVDADGIGRAVADFPRLTDGRRRPAIP